MDTLAAYYGSDSDNSSHSNEPLVRSSKDDEASSGSLAKPFPESRKRARYPPLSPSSGHAAELRGAPDDSNNGSSEHHGDHPRARTADSVLILPPPELQPESLVHWSKDYVTPLHDAVAIAEYPRVSADALAQLEAALRAHRQEEEGGGGASAVASPDDDDSEGVVLCRRLRDDREFGNPHQFRAAMVELGILNPLGTTLVYPGDSFQEWERVESLVQLELQARTGGVGAAFR